MEPVELWHCVRCHLIWVPDDEKVCPRCRLNHTVPTHPVEVAGVSVPVKSIHDFGLREGLLDADVRRGLDVLQLGLRCEHGYIAAFLCSNGCNEK